MNRKLNFLVLISVLIGAYNYNDAQSQSKITIPLGRNQHAAAFDQKRGLMLIFGGSVHYKATVANIKELDNRLWGWDRSKWNVLSEKGPSFRHDAKMVYHNKNNNTYLYGGRIINETGVTILDEFWEWNGTSWKQLQYIISPGKRLHSNMAYDIHRNKIVLFGGIKLDDSGKSSFNNDIWEWDGTAWQQITPAKAPAPRFAFSMTYSPALQKILIVGGVNEKVEYFSDIWSWDGQQFELLDNKVPWVELGAGNIACLDSKSKITLLLFGRRKAKTSDASTSQNSVNQGVTWLWDGNIWKELPLKKSPSARENHTMVYDKKHHRILLFGGNGREETNYESPNDIWVFKNNSWKLIK